MADAVSTFISPHNNVPPDISTRLTGLLKRLGAQRGLHHASYAVVSTDGARQWAGSVGPEATHEPPITPDAPFFIASITKRFIVTLVLQAHERGELHLDSPVAAYLPEGVMSGLHMKGDVDCSTQVTVRHLASHTSGLPDFFESSRGGTNLFRELRAGRDQSWTFNDVIDMNRQQRPHFDPQDLTARTQKARYSDTGFQLLIKALEHVTSLSFPDLLAARITNPLGLTDTWHPNSTPPPAAPSPLPLYAKRTRVDLPGVIRSSNDLFSTLHDLLTFERSLVTGALFSNPHTRDLLTERRNRLRNAPNLRYGLGTMTFDVNRLMVPAPIPVSLVGHSGSTGTWLFTAPALGVHLVGTVNQTQSRALPFQVMAKTLRIWTR